MSAKRYFRHKLQNLIVVSKVVTIHYFEFDKNFRVEGEAHDFWELVYADKESIICTADGKEIELAEGEVLFHKPNEFHTLAANGKRAPNVFIISFECKSEAMRFFENRRLRPEKSFVGFIYSILEESKKTFDIPYSTPELKKLKLLASPTLGGEQLIKNYLELFLINLMRSLTETERGNEIFLAKEELDSKPVKDVLRILREHVEGELSVDEVCAAVGYSRAYVFKEFKAYYMALKIERAKQYLREGELSVKQIALRLCFADPNYFSKTFKRHTGFSPGVYQKRSFAHGVRKKQ
ncbi:MAG: helix-turn-helix transcriptional regulator [Ruminococcaceae bacterium]|nr:helix-turn-helix transcriptional regulator [Oscillospiraceae bacterium]